MTAIRFTVFSEIALCFRSATGAVASLPLEGAHFRPNDKAKYINSPKTSLFDKGSVLYNHHRARDASFKRSEGADYPIIVAEGYMDVIAFHDAGIPTSVAPLGTALTESHLQTLWRTCDEPVLCLDGDRAGLKAAHAVVDRALPLLEPGRSLWFCLLPSGKDPDDIVRLQGPDALKSLLEERKSLIDILWQKERDAKELNTPDRRAGFQKALRDKVSTIRDATVRQYYSLEIRNRLAEMSASNRPAQENFAPAGRQATNRNSFVKHGQGNSRRGKSSIGRNSSYQSGTGSTSALKNSALAKSTDQTTSKEELLILIVINHPWILDEVFDEFSALAFRNPSLDRLRNQILSIVGFGEYLDRESLHHHLREQGGMQIVDKLSLLPVSKLHDYLRPDADAESVRDGWKDCLRLRLIDQTEGERRIIEEALSQETTEENFNRLVSWISDQRKLEHEIDQ